jgi:hypothetical protein
MYGQGNEMEKQDRKRNSDINLWEMATQSGIASQDNCITNTRDSLCCSFKIFADIFYQQCGL